MIRLHSIVFLLLFLFPFRIFAQQKSYVFQHHTSKDDLPAKSDGLSQNVEWLKIDSLKKILESLKDTERIDNLNKLSYLFIAAEQKDSAEHYANLAYQEAKLDNYIHGLAISFSIKAYIARHCEADFVKSEKLAKESLKWYERTGNKSEIDTAYNYLMYSFIAQSRFDEIIDYAEKRYVIAKQIGDQVNMFSSLSWLLNAYKESGNYEQSFILAQKRAELAFQTSNKIAISTSLYRIGELYYLIENYTDALLYFRRVLKMDDNETRARRIYADNDIWLKMFIPQIFSHLHQFDSAWHYYNLYKPAKDKTVYLRIYCVSIGEFYFLQKDYKQALQNFKFGLAEHKKLNDRNQVMRTLLDMGKTYLALNNYTEAFEYGREGLNIALQTKSKQFIRDGYQILYSVYEGLNQKDSAYFYYKKYIIMKDVVTSDQLKGKFIAYNYDKRIDLLNKEKQLEKSNFINEAFQKKIFIAGIFTLFLLSIITFRNILLKRRNEAHRREIVQNELQLQNNELQLQKLESQKKHEDLQLKAMVATQEEERKRISRDLHDDVGTKLSALKLFLSSLHEKAADTNNAEIQLLAESSEQFITEAMQDVRQLLFNLSPMVLEEFGYTTAVEGLVNKINETKQLHFNLVVFGMNQRLRKDHELALYRITQELINNVLKHAEAKNVSLQIGLRDEKIILMVEDDGKGFDVTGHKNGYGLHNLEARTKLMHGTMIIDSHPGNGTSVLIEIPYG